MNKLKVGDKLINIKAYTKEFLNLLETPGIGIITNIDGNYVTISEYGNISHYKTIKDLNKRCRLANEVEVILYE